MLFYDIVGYLVDGTETMHKYDIFISKNGGNRLRETTKGRKILIWWKYYSATWESMKDVK